MLLISRKLLQTFTNIGATAPSDTWVSSFFFFIMDIHINLTHGSVYFPYQGFRDADNWVSLFHFIGIIIC